MIFEEKTLDSERIYEGKIINIRKDHVTVINGESYREIVEHQGGAVIAAITDDNKMIIYGSSQESGNTKEELDYAK